jgi:hypothetical protein
MGWENFAGEGAADGEARVAADDDENGDINVIRMVTVSEKGELLP